jgi:hypothetical protein
VICDDFHAGLRCLPDVSSDGVNRTIPFGTLAQFLHVIRLHGNCSKDDAAFVAIVSHPLEFIRIPTVLFKSRDFGGKVLHSVPQVVFKVLFRGDLATSNTVVVTANMHQGILAGVLRRCEGVPGDARDCHACEPDAKLSSVNHGAP